MNTSKRLARAIALICLAALGAARAFAVPGDGRPLVQIALLLDTSNSMDGLIDQAKSQLWNIVSETGKYSRRGERARLEVALYEYGNDSNSVFSGYVRRVMPFTSDLDALSARLFELDTNGGEEYCALAIRRSLDELDWSSAEADLRIVYIAGNEPFTQGLTDYRDSGKRAVRMGVTVNTIFCGSREEGIRTGWADGAMITGGAFANINGDYRYEYVPCPQDDRLSELNRRLNDTYIAYGEEGEARKELQEEQDVQAESLNREGFFKRAKVKSSGSYANSSWDLVDAAASGAAPLASMPSSELPPEMRNLSPGERDAYVARKQEERKAIQAEIAALSAEREAFLAAGRQNAGAEESLDRAMLDSLGNLAESKGFVRGE